MLSIDSTNPMSTYDGGGLRKTAAISFVNDMTVDNYAGVHDLDLYGAVIQSLKQDHNTVITKINSINSSGYFQNLYSGILHCNNSIINSYNMGYITEDTNKKAVILLKGPGGVYEYTSFYLAVGDEISRADENDIAYYTISLCDSGNTSLMQMMAGGTDGLYYSASSAGELAGIYDDIKADLDTYWEEFYIDSDGDGLNDAYEIIGMRTPNGIVHTDVNNADTDGDGISDADEMGEPLTEFGWVGETLYEAVCFNPSSNPMLKDSDGDEIEDQNDSEPLVYTAGSILLFQSYTAPGYMDEWRYQKAPDMEFNDKSYEDILELTPLFAIELNSPLYSLFANMRILCALGGLKPVMEEEKQRLVNRFESGVGGEYRSSVLTNVIQNHKVTQEYVNFIIDELNSHLRKNNGQLIMLAHRADINNRTEFYNDVISAKKKVSFNSLSDIVWSG